VRLKTIFFDAGGVLVVPNWSRVSDTLERHGVTVPAEALRAAEPTVKFAIDQSVGARLTTDAKRWLDYFDAVLETAGVPASAGRDAAVAEVRAYHHAHNLWEDVLPDAVPALERLTAAGLRLAVASNANGTVPRCFQRLGLDKYFHAICDSHLEGVEKPDPRFFQILLDRTDSQPESTIHIGDLYHVDVVGGRNAGLQVMLLDRDDLYGSFDAKRVRTLGEFVDHIL
jgi:HAD superfamily hydrolase (TIGR01509 family)